MKKTWIFLLLMLALALPACKKFLDINRASDTNPTPVTVDDFDQMLNTTGICETSFELLRAPTDDADVPKTPVEPYYGFAIWFVDPWQTRPDDIYGTCYKWIAQMNMVINSMPTALPTGQMNDRRALAIAQAKINRAYFYFQLVNIYGPAYQPASAGTDLGVPLILQVSSQVSYPRASVEQVYQQILTDLKDALATPELPDFHPDKNVIRPGKAAALALLARAYLYMGNYTQAEKAASAALAIRSSLLSYLNYKVPNSTNDGRMVTLLQQQLNSEVLLARISQAADPRFVFSSDLVSIFDKTNDRRYTSSYIVSNRDGAIYLFGRVGSVAPINQDNGIGVPEMMLTKAECLARANDPVGAVNLLNTLRATRIVSNPNLNLPTNVTADQALVMVLQERRRELMFKGGTRLFDLKRLNLDSRFKKDIRKANGLGNFVTLPAGSPNYVFPFTRASLIANPLLVQNPRVQL